MEVFSFVMIHFGFEIKSFIYQKRKELNLIIQIEKNLLIYR